MNKKSVGVLVGAAAGAIAFRVSQETDPVVIPIVVDSGEGGLFRLTTKPLAYVHLRFRQRVIWEITNNSDYDVRVAVENWRRPNGGRVQPAAFADDPDQPGLWRIVTAHQHAKIRAKGRLAEWIVLPEECEYDIYVNDVLAADPIVKLVL